MKTKHVPLTHLHTAEDLLIEAGAMLQMIVCTGDEEGFHGMTRENRDAYLLRAESSVYEALSKLQDEKTTRTAKKHSKA
jgi:hypothetical protein